VSEVGSVSGFLGLAAAWLLVAVAGAAHAQTLTDDPAFALYRQAVQAAETKDYARASELARQAIAAYPDHLLAWYLLGQAAMGRGAWEEAADAFGNVTRRYPDSFAAQRDLGLALEHLGRVDDARAAFETALARQPDNQDVRIRLAFMLYDKGQRDAALPHLEALAGANTTAPEVWLVLARTYYDRGDLLGSEKAFTRAAALRDDGKTWFNLGVVRLRLNDAAGAQDAFTHAAGHAEVREQATRELDKLRAAAIKPAPK
jgi:tetratricopeptide (TPR) repeat protein